MARLPHSFPSDSGASFLFRLSSRGLPFVLHIPRRSALHPPRVALFFCLSWTGVRIAAHRQREGSDTTRPRHVLALFFAGKTKHPIVLSSLPGSLAPVGGLVFVFRSRQALNMRRRNVSVRNQMGTCLDRLRELPEDTTLYNFACIFATSLSSTRKGEKGERGS